MWQYVTICDNMLQHLTICDNMLQHVTICDNMLQHVTVCDNMLHMFMRGFVSLIQCQASQDAWHSYTVQQGAKFERKQARKQPTTLPTANWSGRIVPNKYGKENTCSILLSFLHSWKEIFKYFQDEQKQDVFNKLSEEIAALRGDHLLWPCQCGDFRRDSTRPVWIQA